MTRAAIYLRLSKETDSSTSIERQRADCIRLAEARGWEVVLVEEDVDVSATHRRLDRPGLDRIRAEFPRLDAVIFWKSDRLARSIVDFAVLMEEAESAGVALVSATEPLDFSTPIGRAMAQIVAIFAEMEAKTIGLRVSSSIEHLRRTGKEPGGRLPFGYRRVQAPDGKGTVYVLDPEEAAVVREAARRAIAGESILTICEDFSARGILTRSGATLWRTSTLGGILKSPHLLGYTVHRGEIVRGDDGLPLAPRPPVLSLDEWDLLQDALARRSGSGSRPRREALLLSGLAVCERCGARLVSHTRGDTGAQTYRCSGTSMGARCSGLAIAAVRLEPMVVGAFLERFGGHAEIRFTPDAPGADRDVQAEIRASLETLETDRYERGLFQGDEAVARWTALHARLSARLDALDSSPRRTRGWTATGRTLREAWGAADTVGRRVMIESVLAEPILVRRGKRGGATPVEERVSIVWKSAGDAGSDEK